MRRDHGEPPPFEVTKLPGSPDLEKIILGSIMYGGLETFERVSSLLSREDFLLYGHGLVWAAMEALAARREPIDRVTVTHELIAIGTLDSVGGVGALADMDGVPEVVASEAYCRRIKDGSQRRRAMIVAQALLAAAADETQPLSEVTARATAHLDAVQVGPSAEEGRTPEQIVTTYPGGVSAFMDASLRRQGLPTGFTQMDEMTSGMHPGQLLVVGARPGVGKSSYLLNVAENLVLRHGKAAVIFSLEMTASALLTRLMCSVARVDSKRFRLGYITKEERHKLQWAMGKITESRLTIFDRFGISVPEIAKHVRALKKEDRCDFLGVDYIQLLGGKQRERRDLEVSEQTRSLKIMAGEIDAPIMALSQLSRLSERRTGDKRPMLSDLRESGAIENDADCVILLHRPEMYDRDRDDLRGQAEAIIAKQREGELGIVRLSFLGHLTRFENRAEDIPEESSRDHRF